MDIDTLIRSARDGDDRSLARLLSEVEQGTVEATRLASRLYLDGGNGQTVGITGAPGAGKSTLVSHLVSHALAGTAATDRVAVTAVDPSSPFSGGAILGDRIRMGHHSGDERVYVRSVANRGHLGGLSASMPAILAVLDGVGFAEIVVETVGVGQAEVDIATACLTTIVVVPAGWGDSVQAAKAGLLEVADIFVVNKADRPEVDRTISDLGAMLDTGPTTPWRPPVLATIASDGRGTEAVWESVNAHRAYLVESGAVDDRRRAIARASLRAAVARSLDARLANIPEDVLVPLVNRQTDPWSLAASMLDAQ